MGKTEGNRDQPAPENVTPLLAPLQALQNLLTAFNDIDILIENENLEPCPEFS